MRDTKVDSSTEKSEEIKFKKEENREFIITLIVYIISSLLIFLFIAEKFNSISPMTTVGYFFSILVGMVTGFFVTAIFYLILILPKSSERNKVIIQKAERAKRLEKMQKEEEADYNEYNKYSDCFGRDKRIAMLLDEKKSISEKISSIKNNQIKHEETKIGLLEKEHDPYVHGGIAAGIAGTGAGIVRALEIQQKNAEIRERNAQVLEHMQNVAIINFKIIHDYEMHIMDISREIKELSNKMISEESPNSCFEKLAFTGDYVRVSANGSCRISTHAQLSEPFFISDGVEGVIDGTIIAEIYDGDVCVGKANLVLPKYGIDSSKRAELNGIALLGGDADKEYTVKFCPSDNLWAMEK